MDRESMATSIRHALTLCKGKVSGPHSAAEMLGVNCHTLRSRMRKLGISAKLPDEKNKPAS